MKLAFSSLVFGRKRGMGERVGEIEIILKKKAFWLGEDITVCFLTLMGAEQLNGWKKATTEIQIMFYKW